MYSYLFFGIVLLGIFSIIENLKGSQKLSILKVHIILFLTFLILSNSADFLFELGYNFNNVKTIVRVLGFIAFSNVLYFIAIHKIPKFILFIEGGIIIFNFIILFKGFQFASIQNGILINELTIYNKLNFIFLIVFTLGSFIYNLVMIFKNTDKNNLYQVKVMRWAYQLIIILVAILLILFAVTLIYNNIYIPFDIRLFFIITRLGTILFILSRPKFIDDSGFSFKPNVNSFTNNCLTISTFNMLFYDHFYYLKTEANIVDFSLKINHKKEEVLELLKKQTDDSFIELINKNRINYLLEMLKSNKHQIFKIEALSEMAGFNNRRSMYYAFQKYVGVTPTEYILSLK